MKKGGNNVRHEILKMPMAKGEVIVGKTPRGVVRTKKSHYVFNYWLNDALDTKITYTSEEFKKTQNLNRLEKEFNTWVEKVKKEHEIQVINQLKAKGQVSAISNTSENYAEWKLSKFALSMVYRKDLVNYYAASSIRKNREFFESLTKKFDPKLAVDISDPHERKQFKNQAKIINSVINKKVSAITEHDVYQLFTALNRDEDTQKNRLKPKTIQRYKSNFSMPFKTLVRWGMLTKNVVDSYTPPKTYNEDRIMSKQMRNHGTKDDVLEVWEIKVVEENVDKMPKIAGTVVQFALLTGLRNGEIYGLTWDNIDFTNKRLYIGKVITYNDITKSLEVKYETKNGDTPRKPRILVLYPKLERLLTEYKAWQDEQYEKRSLNRKKPDKDFVFCKTNQEWYNRDYFSSEWRKFRSNVLHVKLTDEENTAEIEAEEIDEENIGGIITTDEPPLIKHKTTFHNLRGTFASYLLNSEGVPAGIVKDLLGHNDIQTTVEYYVKTTNEHLDSLLETLFQ